MRLLLIEDDAPLARGISAALAQNGHEVDVAPTFTRARGLARTGGYGMAILDLGLPDGDGIDLLLDVRRAGLAFPILILSARDRLEDRVRGLDAGADDYLVKPFSLRELEARLRALSRRGETQPPAFRLGRLSLDPGDGQAWVGGERLDLTPRELAILEALLARANRIVAKQALFDAVFPAHTDAAPNALEVQVSRLRHKLRRSGVAIRSVRGLGYRIEPCAGDDDEPA
jgi:DNA-binding response OmpR family regulator